MSKQSTIEVHAASSAIDHASPGFLAPDVSMVLMTWITFFLLLAILYKLAWKPILNGLDEREKNIERSLDEADRIHKEMVKLNEKREALIDEAKDQSKKIIEDARRAAHEAAKHIQDKAKEGAQISLENALREIKEETQKAQRILREESAHIAVKLASKIIEESLDEDKSRKIINRFIKEI